MRLRISGALVCLLFVLTACDTDSAEVAQETTEMAAEGQVKKLDEKVPEAGEGARVLVIAMDGVGRKDFTRLVEESKSERLAALLGKQTSESVYEHAYAVPDAISILPSTTIAAWTSIYTGEPPAKTGVPGNEWYDRRRDKFFAPAPVSAKSKKHTLAMVTSGFVGEHTEAPTLFEKAEGLQTHVSMAPLYRGADVYTRAHPKSFAELFSVLVEGVDPQTPVKREAYEEIDDDSLEAAVDAIEEHGVPDLQVVYFPGIDLFTHAAKNPIDSQHDYFRKVIDPNIATLLERYEKAGVLRDTYVVFISDHGHTPVLPDDKHSLAVMGDDEPGAVLEQVGFRVRKPQVEPESQDYQAVFAMQGAMAYLSLADRTTCAKDGDKCNWKTPPRFEEDVLPVAKAFWEANQTGEGVPELEGTLDMVLARRPTPSNQDAAPYEVFDGEKLVPVAKWLEANPRDDLIAFAERIEQLSAGPHGHHAGDVLLMTKTGTQRPIEDRYYFSKPYHSWHGSAHPSDSQVPMVVAHPAKSGDEIRQKLAESLPERPTHLDFTPMVLDLLGKSEANGKAAE